MPIGEKAIYKSSKISILTLTDPIIRKKESVRVTVVPVESATTRVRVRL